MEEVSRTIYGPDGTVTRTTGAEKPKKKGRKKGWLRVLAWQTAISALLCLGAAGLRRYDPDRAEKARALLVAREEDPVSQAARCFLEDLAAGEPVAVAVSAFYGELTGLGGS